MKRWQLFAIPGLLLAALVFTNALAEHDSSSACRSACYARKTKDYEACRNFPASERAKREKCFSEADQKLQRCLNQCTK